MVYGFFFSVAMQQIFSLIDTHNRFLLFGKSIVFI